MINGQFFRLTTTKLSMKEYTTQQTIKFFLSNEPQLLELSVQY